MRLAILCVVGAVLLGVLGWFTLRGTGEPDEAPPVPVITCVMPVGSVEDFSRFEWTTGPDGCTYELEILGDDGLPVQGGQPGAVLETSWTPPAQDLRTWPRRITWTVVCFDERGSVIGKDTAGTESHTTRSSSSR